MKTLKWRLQVKTSKWRLFGWRTTEFVEQKGGIFDFVQLLLFTEARGWFTFAILISKFTLEICSCRQIITRPNHIFGD